MKDEVVKSVFWAFFWLLLLLALFASMCGPVDAQTTVHTQGSRHQYNNGTSSFNRTMTITSVAPIAPPQQLLYTNPYYEKAVQMDAKEEARKCAVIILDTVNAEAWRIEYRQRVNVLSEDDQEALRERILENENCFNEAMLDRLLEEAEIANTLVREKP
jgi:hypothetical protein